MLLAGKFFQDGRVATVPSELMEDAKKIGAEDLFNKKEGPQRYCVMLVDYTFFQGGILDIEGAVLNIHTPSETNKAIVGLQGFVMQYEPEYLRSS